MKIAWITDPHLNFLDDENKELLYQDIRKTECDLLFITGDISEAPTVCRDLTHLSEGIEKPIYFVLGNHDYYGGSFLEVRIEAAFTSPSAEYLGHLNTPCQIKKGVYVVGVDGWYDLSEGSYKTTSIWLNDFNYIKDLKEKFKMIGFDRYDKKLIGDKVKRFSKGETKSLHEKLIKTCEGYSDVKEIFILTHVPPFKQNSTYLGKRSGINFLPFYCNKNMGVMLKKFCALYPDIKFTVLCGHTHDPSEYQPLPNLIVKSGESEYYNPRISEVFVR